MSIPFLIFNADFYDTSVDDTFCVFDICDRLTIWVDTFVFKVKFFAVVKKAFHTSFSSGVYFFMMKAMVVACAKKEFE